MGGLANATHTLHRLHSLRYWDLGPKPLVGHCSGLADALIRVYDDGRAVIETHEHNGDFNNAEFSLALRQRAGIARPRAKGDGLSGVTSDRESSAFISGPAGLVGGLPLRRAMNPWKMPDASR